MEVRFSSDPKAVKNYTTEELRNAFLMDKLMEPVKINFVYSHYDRMVIGGAMPVHEPINLETYEQLKADYFLERREMGIINTGGAGTVTVAGETYLMQHKDCIYIGRGNRNISFASKDSENPAKFYICSTPAHKEYPTTFASAAEANAAELGSAENCNERILSKYIHKDGIKSCQLVMGFTTLKNGSNWNSVPCHTHLRRTEVYYYFDLPEDNQLFHFMGEENETRHLIMHNDNGIISPPWSVHFGVGTASYTFIWAMAGENQEFTDMDLTDMTKLK